jgi:lysophospholipase L1-like esterase
VTAAQIAANAVGASELADTVAERLDALELLPVSTVLAPTWLEVWGHSYTTGNGGTASRLGFSEVVADRLGLPLRCRGRAGSSAASENTFNQCLRSIERVAQFSVPQNLNVMMWGLNDLTAVAAAANVPGGNLEAALLTNVSRMRSGSPVFPYTDASFTFNGSWATVANNFSAGTGWKYTTSGAATYSIATPADFPGGTVAIGLASQATLNHGAVHTATIGSTTATVTAKSQYIGTSHYFVLRVPDVPAGAQTISVAISDLTATSLTAVDGWWWECAEDEGPIVVLVKQPTLTATGYATFSGSGVDDDKIAALNTVYDGIATAFGERVIIADGHLPTMNKALAYFNADEVHPNDKGHALIADAVMDALADGMVVVAAGGRAGAAPRWRAAAAPTSTPESAWGYNKTGTIIDNTAPAEAGSASSKYVTTGWICTAAGGPGTWLPMRTLTGN